MDEFAVIQTNGRQYIVSPKQEIVIDDTHGEVGKSINFEEVLATFVKGKIVVGKPLIEKAMVKAKVLEQGKGEKIKINKFKAKSRYRKAIGYRKRFTKLLIVSI